MGKQTDFWVKNIKKCKNLELLKKIYTNNTSVKYLDNERHVGQFYTSCLTDTLQLLNIKI